MPDWSAVCNLPREERVPIYERYLADNPRDAAVWFDLGIAFKLLHRWADCISANEHALAIAEDPSDPAWWNMGIAATALRHWSLARKAWKTYGLEINDDDGPVSCNYGMAPVRLPHGEVVWGERLDPARLIIRNVPLPESGYRWGDVVLHDGAPNGERRVNGRVYGVFDVLEKWSPSEVPTYAVHVTCSADDSEALVQLFEANRFAAEDWSENVRTLCHACSVGLPDGHGRSFGSDEDERNFGIAAPKGLAEKLLEDWVNGGSGRSHGALEPVR